MNNFNMNRKCHKKKKKSLDQSLKIQITGTEPATNQSITETYKRISTSDKPKRKLFLEERSFLMTLTTNE